GAGHGRPRGRPPGRDTERGDGHSAIVDDRGRKDRSRSRRQAATARERLSGDHSPDSRAWSSLVATTFPRRRWRIVRDGVVPPELEQQRAANSGPQVRGVTKKVGAGVRLLPEEFTHTPLPLERVAALAGRH